MLVMMLSSMTCEMTIMMRSSIACKGEKGKKKRRGQGVVVPMREAINHLRGVSDWNII